MTTKAKLLEVIDNGLHGNIKFADNFEQNPIMFYKCGFTMDSVLETLFENGIEHEEVKIELYTEYPFSLKFI